MTTETPEVQPLAAVEPPEIPKLISFVVYDLATGAIRWAGKCMPSELQTQAPADPTLGVASGEGAWNTHYVAGGLVRGKTDMPGGQMGNGPRFVGLPIPCKVTVNGQVYHVDDGVADFEFNLPGTYKIVVEAAPYLTRTFHWTQE